MELSKKSMTPRRLLAIALVLALGIPTVFSLLPGCESTPSEPVYENPFDPEGPDGGDPLKAMAESDNQSNTVQISWLQPQGMGLTHYIISSAVGRDSTYSTIGDKDHTTAENNSFPYTGATSTATLWYRVQAFTDNDFTITSYANPDSATTGPKVIVGNDNGTTATRFTHFVVTVTRGDQVRVALDPDFTESLEIFPVVTPGDSITFTYDLGPASKNNERKIIYFDSFADGYQSVVSSRNIGVDFNPAFTVVDDPATLAIRSVDLTIPTEGVLSMRFFADWADSAATPWVPVSNTYPGYLLSDSANDQFIRAQFQGDFGFIDDQEIKVTPDLLKEISFKLVWPDSNSILDESIVLGASYAVATQMRYSESPDFTNAPWIAYQDTVQIQLSPTPGQKVIHVQYRNDWTMSGTLTDYVIHVTQPAEVSFWSPLDGDAILGNSVFQVRGGSTVGSGEGSVIQVHFDSGDGDGFNLATGTDSWSYLWDVPRFTTDTPVVLRAKAWYGPIDSLETVTTAITVTVTQLASTITTPSDGADLRGNRVFTFTGTASGVLGGTALDSVFIDIGDDHFKATGKETWTAKWTAPLWDTDTPLTMTTTSWAAADTAVTTIAVNVITPAIAITEPLQDTLVSMDTDQKILCTTFAHLFPVPVEAVELNIAWDDTTTTLPTTLIEDKWEATWRAPVVEGLTAATIIATATAGAEARADTISVTVKP